MERAGVWSVARAFSKTAVSASLKEEKARWSAYPHLSDGAVTGTLGMG